ncbi:hypothetical protein BX600DRAFT_429399 [Xylariales sp. PMI_506]|nr:hypothetical protein BX600DRAFT_429399 [Xylariales sp. PMI_506]
MQALKHLAGLSSWANLHLAVGAKQGNWDEGSVRKNPTAEVCRVRSQDWSYLTEISLDTVPLARSLCQLVRNNCPNLRMFATYERLNGNSLLFPRTETASSGGDLRRNKDYRLASRIGPYDSKGAGGDYLDLRLQWVQY